MHEVKIDLDKRRPRVAARIWSRTPRAIRSSRSSCWRPTRRWPRLLAEAELALSPPRASRLPTRASSKRSTEFVTDLGFQTESLESRFELQKLLARVAGKPEQHAVNYAVLRSLQRAVYSPAEEGHYALASDCYCHFTSPIRRYPDLTIHRLLDNVAARQETAQRLWRSWSRWASIAPTASSGPRPPSAS